MLGRSLSIQISPCPPTLGIPPNMNKNINEKVDAPKYKSMEKRSAFLQVDNLFIVHIIFVPALVSIMMRFVTALDNSLGLNYKQLGDWILTIENEK